MRAAIDLHIHSCLSPCADELMTPNNIVNMAKLKGLDMIAVSDHNSALNLPAVFEVARGAGLSVIPAIELNTAEEVHLLAYFRRLEDALEFSDEIYAYLPDIPNYPDIFGRQQVMDADDNIVREENERLYISALTLGIDRLTQMIHEIGGVAVPAHINRPSSGILDALGFIPPDSDYDAIEVVDAFPLPNTGLPHVRRFKSSDAHYIGDILEPSVYVDVEELTCDALIGWMREGKLSR